MNFNKAPDSERYHVGFNDNKHAGTLHNAYGFGYCFDQNVTVKLSAKEMIEIGNFMQKLDDESGIDTTSTFTSNESIK